MRQPVCSAARQSGMLLNAPPTSLPFGTATFVPSRIADTSRDCIGLPSISSAMRRGQHHRALRVANEHDAAAVVVVLQVVVPGIEHVVVAGTLIEWQPAAAGHRCAQAGQRDLTIHRRKRAALRSEARELLADDVLLGRSIDMSLLGVASLDTVG